MDQQYYFKHAKWMSAAERKAEGFYVLQSVFSVEKAEQALLRVLGLGFFKCYINGVCVNPDTFLPLSSEFEAGHEPEGEVFTANRVYVPEFEVGALLREGENLLEIVFGGGWYTFDKRCFGLPKAIYCLTAGEQVFVSDESCTVSAAQVCDYYFTKHEDWDLTAPLDFAPAVEAEPLVTDYCVTDCPADALQTELPLREVADGVYDCGRNTSGYPVLRLTAAKGEKVTVTFSEELLDDGTLDLSHHHGQVFSVVSDGTGAVVQPEFTWFGFRYFKVEGGATPLCVKEIFADVAVNSTFESDNEVLNWIYRTFIHTMHTNMHTGHPSDCPHLERRGYTGDGQLTTHAVLTAMDAKAFYEKWLQDIADSQDTLSGHIQYTAPYIRSGGGPGGWGCAMVEVPYQLYRHYGDKEILAKYYGNMRRYIDYLESHSEFGLVTSDRAGEWCLGDWCGPIILYPDKDISSHNQQVMLPAAMVNTYFMVKTLGRLAEIAKRIGKEEDVAEYETKIKERKAAIQAAYYNAFDGNFVMNVQGANAFAVDLGLGGPKTYENLVRYYTKVGCYDTGIFATDILTRVLLERGDAELAVRLLIQSGQQGFAHWRDNGATTFHEYWDSNRSRSHNHPMFGAPVAYLFEHLLGIGQAEGSVGYRKLVIAPQLVSAIGQMKGSMTTPQGVVAVAYRKQEDGVRVEITLPKGTEAVLRLGGREIALQEGENTHFFPKD
ncbi:MAG: family 78 glycoside hydrolase catalytic domain [Clostridia bacterium]|nr:family 78 glycoside hydrolase catalytic domain [Clostridia bacterium]